MQTKITLTIPQDKINGERIGQIIINAMSECFLEKTGYVRSSEIFDELLNIENDRLQEIINNYLK